MAVDLTPAELDIFQRTIRTGDLDIFTQVYFKLPKGGTIYTPEDRVSQFEMLYETWKGRGSPDDEFEVDIDYKPTQFQVVWDPYYAPYPIFLMPHGWRSLEWLKRLIDPKISYGLAITGAGTGKTAGVAVAALTLCALYPGFGFLNLAPTEKQARLMLGEIEKWAGNTEFRQFIAESKGTNPLWIERPHPTITVEVFKGYPSTFSCQTVGRDCAKAVLGDEQDWINADEAALLTNIIEMHPMLVSRFRATRSTGEMRLGKLTWISNPGPGAAFRALLQRYKDMQKENPEHVVVLEEVHSSANIYVTKRQLELQRMTMTDREAMRWQGGAMSAIYTDTELGEYLCEMCFDPDLEEQVQKVGFYDGDFGLREYELPYENGHQYIVAGDVGKSDVVNMSSENIPCIMVFDVTDFLEKPTKLVAFYWFDGEGTYRTFANKFKRALRKYRAYGYYDATNVQSAMEDFGDAFGALPNTYPIFFSGMSGQLRWCVGAATLMMQDGMFAWPRIKAMWYQADVYTSAKKHIPKDIISALFVFFQALRQEGALYDKLMQRFEFYEGSVETPVDAMQPGDDFWDPPEVTAPSRYARAAI